jgi:hypothetical protein
VLCDCFKSRRRLEAEILVLRYQLNVLQQRAPRRLHLRWADRALFIWLYRRCPRILDAVTIVRPETVLRWHRMGFAAYRRWKSRPRGGRPRIGKEVRDLIRRMSIENPLWGVPKIHGEPLKLGIDVAQSTVSVYMVPRQGRPSQTGKSFLRNHMEEIASIDLFVVPTIAFQQLVVFLVLGHRRRQAKGQGAKPSQAHTRTAGGYRPEAQPAPARMVELLWALLSVGDVSNVEMRRASGISSGVGLKAARAASGM